MAKQKEIKFGECPYCKSEDYDQTYSEFQASYCGNNQYVIMDCYCNNCEKSFTEYYTIDEVKFDVDEDVVAWGDALGKSDKETLIKALDVLIEKEGDTKDHTELINLLKGGLRREE